MISTGIFLNYLRPEKGKGKDSHTSITENCPHRVLFIQFRTINMEKRTTAVTCPSKCGNVCNIVFLLGFSNQSWAYPSHWVTVFDSPKLIWVNQRKTWYTLSFCSLSCFSATYRSFFFLKTQDNRNITWVQLFWIYDMFEKNNVRFCFLDVTLVTPQIEMPYVWTALRSAIRDMM